MGRGNKRTKRDDSSLESSPSNSVSSMLQTPKSSKQLDEISTKLSLILQAVTDLTTAVKESNQEIAQSKTDTAITELPAVLKSIDEELKRKTIPNNTGRIKDQRNDGANGFENKAMRIKACIGGIWENKLQARKSAYWGYVRNSGNLRFHEKWMSADAGIVIPRKIQKFEIKNENDQQRALRERSVLYDFKNEIEMEKLKIEACIEQYRRIDMEIEDIIFSKCSGQEADYLFEQWRMIVQQNEQISHKRWLSNEKWLQAYEEEFLKRYANSNPFFKKGKEKPTYAEAVNSKQKQYHHHCQNRPVNEYVKNVQHNQRRYTPNENRNTHTFRRYNQHTNTNRQQERGFTPKSSFKRKDNRQYDVPSLLNGPLMPRTHHNGRGRGRQNNISNNSEWLNDEEAVAHDSLNSFLSMDRNWTYQL